MKFLCCFFVAVFACSCAPQIEISKKTRTDQELDEQYSADDLYRIGKSYNQQGESQKAVSVLKQSLKKEPNQIEASYELGMALSRLGKIQEAIAILRKVHTLDPRHIEAALLLGVTLDLDKKPAAAFTVYQQALKHHPDHVGLLHEAANTLVMLNKTPQAIVLLERARQKQPQSADLLGDLGYAYLVGNQVAKAKETLQKAWQLDSGRADIAFNLGRIALLEKNNKEAVVQFEHAVRLQPDFKAGWLHLGLARLRHGDLKNAKTAALESARLSADNPRAHFLLATIYDALGEKAKALASFKKVIKLDPQFAPAREWLKKFGNLK
jgi:Flp pilus assembly protein TadD